jgi:hypothetical protein
MIIVYYWQVSLKFISKRGKSFVFDYRLYAMLNFEFATIFWQYLKETIPMEG